MHAVNENETRLAAERAICQHMIAELSRSGWSLVGINNGGGYVRPSLDMEERYAEIMAADDCHLKFKNGNGVLHTVYLVFGNAPDEVICDFSYGTSPGDNFELTLEEVQEWAERYWEQRRRA